MTSRSEVMEGAPGQSFLSFFDEAQRSLLPHLRRHVGSVADDVFQDALLIVFQRWDDVEALDHPMAWARTVAMRLAARHHQREVRRPLLEARSNPPAHDDTVDQVHHDLLPALASLRPDHAAALRLTQLEDLDIDEAAARLGVPAGTVKTWVHRGRRRLAERATGLSGRWVSESIETPVSLERTLVTHGHGAYVDDVMPCLVDRPIRWEVHIDRGGFLLQTDDGEPMDQGGVEVRKGWLALTSVATTETIDGIPRPITPGANVGVSTHTLAIDGDRLRLPLLHTEIPPTNGVPDVVFRRLHFDDVVFRWVGAAPRTPKVPMS